jgi:hypothetical protein
MAMFDNEKFMSSLYIRHQMNNDMDGKVGGLWDLTPFHTEAEPGRTGPCARKWQAAVHMLRGMQQSGAWRGGNRVLNNGRIPKMEDMPHKGCEF